MSGITKKWLEQTFNEARKNEAIYRLVFFDEKFRSEVLREREQIIKVRVNELKKKEIEKHDARKRQFMINKRDCVISEYIKSHPELKAEVEDSIERACALRIQHEPTNVMLKRDRE